MHVFLLFFSDIQETPADRRSRVDEGKANVEFTSIDAAEIEEKFSEAAHSKRMVRLLLWILPVVAALGFLGGMLVGMDLIRDAEDIPPPPLATVEPTPAPRPNASEVREKLGNVVELSKKGVAFDDAALSAAMLELLLRKPGRDVYALEFTDGESLFLFWCDFQKKILVRSRTAKNGKGVTERWDGYVLDRLQNATQGGALDDTPKGRREAVLKRF